MSIPAYRFENMRKKLTAGLALVALFTLGTVSPAFADTVEFSYTVAADAPTSEHLWPAGSDCALVNGSRQFTAFNAQVTVSGTYSFLDLFSTADGRIAILEGAYDPTDLSNCVAELDDSGEVELTAGTTYTVLGAGFSGVIGNFTYRVTGDGAFTTSKVASTTTLDAVPAILLPGESVTLTAEVGSVFPATGTVEFFDGSTNLGTQPVSSGSATLSVSTLSLGDHSITAIYSGDAQNASSTSPAQNLTVAKQSTSSAVMASVTNALPGDPLTLDASVISFGSGAVTGSVEFFDGTTSLGVRPLTSGFTSLQVESLSLGVHDFTTVYSGDDLNEVSTSPTTTVTVALQSTTTSLSIEEPTIVGGSAVGLLVFVETSGTTPVTGSVEFFDGETSIGTRELFAGRVAFPYGPTSSGTHDITAVYSGDAVSGPSTSAVATFTVTPRATATTLSSSTVDAVAGDEVTLSAVVTGAGFPPVRGSVEFFAGTASLGVQALTAGKASLSLPDLRAGTYVITAVYSGDVLSSASTSAAVTVTVSAITPTPTPAAVPASTPLASTGVESVTLTLGALLLLVAGAVTLVTARMRRKA